MAGHEAAQAFEMAASETLKAWTSTSLLSMARGAAVERARSAFERGDRLELQELLSEIAGPSFDGYAIKTGMDAGRAMKLGACLLRVLGDGMAEVPCQEGVIARVQWLHRRIKHWIEHGQVERAPGDLAKMTELLGGSPGVRLALLAPFAPALAVCGLLLRADQAHYPFVRGV